MTLSQDKMMMMVVMPVVAVAALQRFSISLVLYFLYTSSYLAPILTYEPTDLSDFRTTGILVEFMEHFFFYYKLALSCICMAWHGFWFALKDML
jgi:hypothetical protein